MVSDDGKQLPPKYPPGPDQRKENDDWSHSSFGRDSVSTRSASSQSFRASDQVIDPRLDPRHQSQSQPRSLSPMANGGPTLPSRDVKDETIDDAYVDFILHCNPSIPPGTDTAELRKAFRSAPKSDGNSFSTYRLFELIRKFDEKELKTWAQVAIALGVEPPALDKGQSAQKVQQYAVRLKRWMHAMHIDAFFEYLLGKQHVYWTQIPRPDDPTSDYGRDGVVPEEDLAIRALLPETRPKRGRRKAEDRDLEGETPLQRRRLNSPTLSEDFDMSRNSGQRLVPASAHPDMQFAGRRDLWPSDGRMPLGGGGMSFPNAAERLHWPQDQTPLSAHPMSAITMSSRLPFHDDEEPRSAITPSRGRMRRRHGPAVSSAWLSTGTSTGKLRGRPPSNRSITDGPFSTFPVNPTPSIRPAGLRDGSIANTPVVGNGEKRAFDFPLAPQPLTPRGRPNGLSLQVPERIGGTVRLATPPPPPAPVNGSGATEPQGNPPHGDAMTSDTGSEEAPARFPWRPPAMPHDDGPSFDNGSAWEETLASNNTNVDRYVGQFAQDLMTATWINESTGDVSTLASFQDAVRLAKKMISDIHTQSRCGQVYLINLASMAGARHLRTNFTVSHRCNNLMETSYDLRWTMQLGPLQRHFSFQTETYTKFDECRRSDDAPGGVTDKEPTAASWKRRCQDLEDQLRAQQKKLADLERGVVDALLKSHGSVNTDHAVPTHEVDENEVKLHGEGLRPPARPVPPPLTITPPEATDEE